MTAVELSRWFRNQRYSRKQHDNKRTASASLKSEKETNDSSDAIESETQNRPTKKSARGKKRTSDSEEQ